MNDATTSYNGTINGTVPINTINTPFLPSIVPPVGRTLGTLGTQQYASQVVQNPTVADLGNHPAGYVQQWNLNIQRNLPWGLFVSAAYVGSKGTHLESYSQQIDQIGDNFLSGAATQCAAQSATTGSTVRCYRCNAAAIRRQSFLRSGHRLRPTRWARRLPPLDSLTGRILNTRD